MTKREYRELMEFLAGKFNGIDRRFEGIESEHRELIDFLGGKFDGIDRRFDGIDGRLDGIDSRLVRVEVLGERSQHDIELVAEGLGGLRTEMIQHFESVDGEFALVRGEMSVGFAAVRGEAVEGFASLERRVGRLEGHSRPW